MKGKYSTNQVADGTRVEPLIYPRGDAIAEGLQGTKGSHVHFQVLENHALKFQGVTKNRICDTKPT